MAVNAPAAVRLIAEEYRRFIRTSYRFRDDDLRSQFEEHLARADVIVKGPFVTLGRDFQPGRPLAEIVSSGGVDPDLTRARWPFGDRPIYSHQERALAAGRAGRPFAVTTGTGSGKTEAFLLPVFDEILRRRREGVAGLQAIFIYPMNALANDQLSRMRNLLRGSGLPISYGLWVGESDETIKAIEGEPAETERQTQDSIRKDPPDILLTNYKQMEFLLARARDRKIFGPSLRYLVLDEVHTYRGALATEMACQIRRLKAHAGLAPGRLLGVATSATLGEGGEAGLAEFVSGLFGERVEAGDVIGEEYAPPEDDGAPMYIPPPPEITAEEVASFRPEADESVVGLMSKLLGRPVTGAGPIADRIRRGLRGNRIVRAIERAFQEPQTIEKAAEFLATEIPERAGIVVEKRRREIEGYLLAGSVGDEADPPRLRPKLHLFVHGVYDVALCLACRRLVPQGGSQCPHCGHAARPAALCRTCGQDFVKVRFESLDDDHPIGTGDFYSNDLTGFLAKEILASPQEEEGDEEADEEKAGARAKAKEKREEAAERFKRVNVCTKCGGILTGDECSTCHIPGTPYLLHHGPLHACPACGARYTRGDIVTPLRTGTASTVSVLVTHHLDPLQGLDRKLLCFADNRQDAAHQAGYTSDKHRVFALRHLLAQTVKNAGAEGVALDRLRYSLFEGYQQLGVIRRGVSRDEERLWREAIQMESADEFTRHSNQRSSLENLGIVAVEYEFLDEVGRAPAFAEACKAAGVAPDRGLLIVRAVLDVMRKYRAVAFPFYQEFLDTKKQKYRELEEEYGVRFPDRDRSPVAFALDRPAHLRKPLKGIVRDTTKGQIPGPHKVAAKVMDGDKAKAEAFLRAVLPLLQREETRILVSVPRFPLPKGAGVAGVRILQIDPKVVRLVPVEKGFRCDACQIHRPYDFPTCPTPRCDRGTLREARVDTENYYVRLYLDRSPQRLVVAEHTAQVDAKSRAGLEKRFKDGKIDALIASPTLELGVDIGSLLTVVLRNPPPTPANYAQRVGRAGRRLRIGFATTFCAGNAHDRHAFENPAWFIKGRFNPPHLRLDNPRVVHRHLRSYILEKIGGQLPVMMGELLDDAVVPSGYRWDLLEPLAAEVENSAAGLRTDLAHLFDADRAAKRTARYDENETKEIVEGFRSELQTTIDRWWARVRQLKDEYDKLSEIGSPRFDKKKAMARERAYRELTTDRERAYSLNYLSTQGFLPAYQFPIDTFSLDPGVSDTPTLYRAASIAIEEFAPGNFVYANGHKLKSIRVLFAGGPGPGLGTPRSAAEASGRLEPFQFCSHCDFATGEARNACASCGEALSAPRYLVRVDAFEAEESLRIGSDEESRDRKYFQRRTNLLVPDETPCRLYPYPHLPAEFIRLGSVLVTNWGERYGTHGEGFWICVDCGRHCPYDRNNPKKTKDIQRWDDHHMRFCSGKVENLLLGYKYETDLLSLAVPIFGDDHEIGDGSVSPFLVTLAEALGLGATEVLGLEREEIQHFVRRVGGSRQEIVYYETVPGGAGYLEEIVQRLPEVAEAAHRRLFAHTCGGGCYLCLKNYRNRWLHPHFQKNAVRDFLLNLSTIPAISATEEMRRRAADHLEKFMQSEVERIGKERRPVGAKGPQSPIEEMLFQAMKTTEGLPEAECQHEVPDDGRILTIPDFAYPEEKVAIYCDSAEFHFNTKTAEGDARKRNRLQAMGWRVLIFWGSTIKADPGRCAREVKEFLGGRGDAG